MAKVYASAAQDESRLLPVIDGVPAAEDQVNYRRERLF